MTAEKNVQKVVMNMLKNFMGIYMSLLLVGCSGLGMMASTTHTFTGKESITLRTPRADILDIVAKVGESLGYDVSGLDKESGTISLSSGSGAFAGTMIGKFNTNILTITVEKGSQKLNIVVVVTGNFGSGGQEAASRLMEDFKTKLLEKTAQS